MIEITLFKNHINEFWKKNIIRQILILLFFLTNEICIVNGIRKIYAITQRAYESYR
jgi:hypothetical protein